jgi:hypothetical protein
MLAAKTGELTRVFLFSPYSLCRYLVFCALIRHYVGHQQQIKNFAGETMRLKQQPDTQAVWYLSLIVIRILLWIKISLAAMRKLPTLVIGKSEGKRPLGRPRCGWGGGIKVYVGEIRWGWGVWSGFTCLRIGTGDLLL